MWSFISKLLILGIGFSAVEASGEEIFPKPGTYIEESFANCLNDRGSFISCEGRALLQVEQSKDSKIKVTMTNFSGAGVAAYYIMNGVVYLRGVPQHGATFTSVTIGLPTQGSLEANQLEEYLRVEDFQKYLAEKVLSGVYFGKNGTRYEFKDGFMHIGEGKKKRSFEYSVVTNYFDGFAAGEHDFVLFKDPRNPKAQFAYRALVKEEANISIFATKKSPFFEDLIAIDINRPVDTLTKENIEVAEDDAIQEADNAEPTEYIAPETQ